MKKVITNSVVLILDSATCVFKGEIYDVYQWPQTQFDGFTKTFEMLRRPDTVSIIGIVKDKILVIDDDQPHVRLRQGFPGGRVEAGDANTLGTAQREMLEETGYEFQTWRLIKVWQPHTKLEWFIYLYLALDGQKVANPHLDAGERIAGKILSFDEVKKMVATLDYLSESKEVFAVTSTLEQLRNFPEFQGQEVER